MAVRDDIQQALSLALQSVDVTISPADVPLEHPAELIHGDYATGVALAKSKEAGMNPRALAEKIVEHLRSSTTLGPTSIQKIEVAGPGFINFILAPDAISATIEEARTTDMWGGNDAMKGSGQMLIEYTSPNLFKPLHVGNLVGNILGEAIARMWQFNGADVKRINYPSDIGLPAAKTVWGLKKTSGDPDDIHALGEAYRLGNEHYESDVATKTEIDAINKKLYEDSDPELSRLRAVGITTSQRHLDELCKQLGTTFDLRIYESEAAPAGKKIVQNNPDIFPESDGARVFKGEEHGLHTRVFLTSAGLPTYEAKDLGNFVMKQAKFPNWEWSVIVTGVEQKEYFAVLYQAIQILFPDTRKKTLKHVPTGFLTPTTGKMSSRKGNVITAESLLEDLRESAKERAKESRAEDKDFLAEQVAVAAIKYEVLKQGSGKNITFDRDRALSLEGDSGPYLQYAYARTCAIMQKAGEGGIRSAADASSPSSLLMRLIPRFPEVVARAAREYEPHLVTTYLLELASAFNSWYAQEQVLDGTPAAAHKVALVEAVGRTLKNGLWILGIPAPEKM